MSQKRERSLLVLQNLYQRKKHHLNAGQRAAALALLRDARNGTLTRQQAMDRIRGLLAGEGITPQQAWRRLRFTPYYRHVMNVLADE